MPEIVGLATAISLLLQLPKPIGSLSVAVAPTQSGFGVIVSPRGNGLTVSTAVAIQPEGSE